LGDLLFKQELQNTERFYQQYGAPPSQGKKQAFHFALADFELVGELDKLCNQQRVLYELNYLSYWQWLDIWLKHLVLSALGHTSTIIYGIEKDEDRQFTLASYELTYYPEARQQLTQLLDIYWQGLQAPLPFFPKTGFNLASRKTEQTVEKVMSTWEGKGQFKGEKNHAEYVLFYQNTNPLIDFKQDFTALTTTIYQPLMACRRTLANKKSES
jgi:exodeoxyribonuclease V gamma subunit